MKLGINRGVLRGSFMLLIAFNIYNALNFIFQALMARMLGLADFSIYGPLSALIYLLAVVTESSQTVIAKYTSSAVNDGKVKNIIKRTLRKSIVAAAVLFASYCLVAIPLSQILRVPVYLMILTGSMIFTSFLIPIGRGVLQGRQKFFALGLNTVGEAIIKIGLGVLLVTLGWKVYGVITAIVLSVLFSFFFSLAPIKQVFRSKEEPAEIQGLYYSLPTFVVLLGITSFYVVDLIIARAVFSDEVAGLYAVVALLGKAIFWGTQPISKALFPISAQNKQMNNDKKNEFGTALIILSLCCVFALILFWLFPELILKLLSGKSGLLDSNILFTIGLAFSILSLANLVVLYKLSLGRTRGHWLLVVALVIETAILYYSRSNITNFSYGLIISSGIFLISAIIALRK